MGGVAASVEQAGVVQDGWGGADGGEPATGGVVGEDGGAHVRIGAEVFHAGAAGEEKQVEEVVADGGERGVGLENEGVAAGDETVFAEGGDGDVNVSAAQEVDRSDGFQLFKTFGKNRKDRGHGRVFNAGEGGVETMVEERGASTLAAVRSGAERRAGA